MSLPPELARTFEPDEEMPPTPPGHVPGPADFEGRQRFMPAPSAASRDDSRRAMEEQLAEVQRPHLEERRHRQERELKANEGRGRDVGLGRALLKYTQADLRRADHLLARRAVRRRATIARSGRPPARRPGRAHGGRPRARRVRRSNPSRAGPSDEGGEPPGLALEGGHPPGPSLEARRKSTERAPA